MITVVLFDLDGVVRHFDGRAVARIEASHGLPTGSIATAAFSEPHLTDVITGRITRAQWVTRIGDHLGNHAAARAWGTVPSRLDDEVLELAAELRSLGLTTAILTNGTDTVPAEFRALGFPTTFGTVFSSAEIGHAKPSAAVFHHVLDALEVGAHEVFFVDDTPGHVTAAAGLGIASHHFTDVSGLRAALDADGIVAAVVERFDRLVGLWPDGDIDR